MRCPVCKAENTAGPACRRCKADLSHLYALEERRERSLATAQAAALARDWQAVARAAAWADHLRRDATTCRLLALAYLKLNRPADARAWCLRWQQLSSE